MNYGEKIAELRKKRGMTQAELGNNLNVTYQAVSKWERGESYPDFITMSKIAKLFDVPLSYFEDNEDGEELEDVPTEEISEKKMLGVCKECGKVVYEGEEFSASPVLVCKACHDRQAARAKRDAEEARERAAAVNAQRAQAVSETKRAIARKRNRGLILAAVAIVLIIIGGIIGLVQNPEDWQYGVIGLLFIVICGYPYIAQVLWNGIVIDITFFAVKIFGGWGVLFTFDLDGFIFLIVMKLLMWLLKIIIALATFLFSFAVAFVVSPFTFVPQLLKLNRGEELRD